MTDLTISPERIRRVILAGAIPGRVVRRLRMSIDMRPVIIDVDESVTYQNVDRCSTCDRLEQQAARLRDEILYLEQAIARTRPSLMGLIVSSDEILALVEASQTGTGGDRQSPATTPPVQRPKLTPPVPHHLTLVPQPSNDTWEQAHDTGIAVVELMRFISRRQVRS